MIFQPQIVGKPLPALTNPGTAADLLSGKQLIDANGNVLTGTMPTQGAQTITPGIAAKTIAAGRYLTGAQTIQGDLDLVPGNIKSGVNIFGVEGTYNLEPTYVSISENDCTLNRKNSDGTYYLDVEVTVPSDCKADNVIYFLMYLHFFDQIAYFPEIDGNFKRFRAWNSLSGTSLLPVGFPSIYSNKFTFEFKGDSDPNSVIPTFGVCGIYLGYLA